MIERLPSLPTPRTRWPLVGWLTTCSAAAALLYFFGA